MTKLRLWCLQKETKLYKCPINSHTIEQTRVFKYLGVVFQAKGTQKAHAENIAQAAQRSILFFSFYHVAGGRDCIPAALKLLVVAFLWSTIGPLLSFYLLGSRSNKVFEVILQVSCHWVSNAALWLQVGYQESWFLAEANFPPLTLTLLILRVKLSITLEESSVGLENGFSVEYLIHLGYDAARLALRHILWNNIFYGFTVYLYFKYWPLTVMNLLISLTIYS